MVRKLAGTLATVGMLSSPLVLGLGLGNAELQSSLNQPLKATIQLSQTQGVSASEIRVMLADEQAFAKAGLDRQFFLQNLDFVVRENSRGAYVELTSLAPVKEPFLNLLLAVEWPQGRLLREYTFLLDPPAYNSSITQQYAQNQPAGAAPRATPLAAPAAGKLVDEGARRIRVGPVDTLWSLARKHRANNDITIKQAMLAIKDANPDAFPSGNINDMEAGSTILVPSENAMLKRDSLAAIREVAKQNRDWVSLKAALAPQTTPKPAAKSATASEPVDQKSLKLIAEKAKPDTSVDNSGALKEELELSKENLDQSEREKEDLSSRLDELQKQIGTLQKLIRLKDEQLSAMETMLAKQNQLLSGKSASEPTMMAEPEKEAEVMQPPVATTSAAAVTGKVSTGAIGLDLAAEAEKQAESESMQEEPVAEMKPEPVVEMEPKAPVEAKKPIQPFKIEESQQTQELEPSNFIMDTLRNNAMILGGAAAAILALVLGLLVMRRRKAEGKKQKGKDNVSGADVAAGAAAGAAGMAAADAMSDDLPDDLAGDLGDDLGLDDDLSGDLGGDLGDDLSLDDDLSADLGSDLGDDLSLDDDLSADLGGDLGDDLSLDDDLGDDLGGDLGDDLSLDDDLGADLGGDLGDDLSLDDDLSADLGSDLGDDLSLDDDLSADLGGDLGDDLSLDDDLSADLGSDLGDDLSLDDDLGADLGDLGDDLSLDEGLDVGLEDIADLGDDLNLDSDLSLDEDLDAGLDDIAELGDDLSVDISDDLIADFAGDDNSGADELETLDELDLNDLDDDSSSEMALDDLDLGDFDLDEELDLGDLDDMNLEDDTKKLPAELTEDILSAEDADLDVLAQDNFDQVVDSLDDLSNIEDIDFSLAEDSLETLEEDHSVIEDDLSDLSLDGLLEADEESLVSEDDQGGDFAPGLLDELIANDDDVLSALDPMAESQQHIDADQYEQAAAVLQGALGDEPDNNELRLKFMEVLVELEDEATFDHELRKVQASEDVDALAAALSLQQAMNEKSVSDMESEFSIDDLDDLSPDISDSQSDFDPMDLLELGVNERDEEVTEPEEDIIDLGKELDDLEQDFDRYTEERIERSDGLNSESMVSESTALDDELADLDLELVDLDLGDDDQSENEDPLINLKPLDLGAPDPLEQDDFELTDLVNEADPLDEADFELTDLTDQTDVLTDDFDSADNTDGVDDLDYQFNDAQETLRSEAEEFLEDLGDLSMAAASESDNDASLELDSLEDIMGRDLADDDFDDLSPSLDEDNDLDSFDEYADLDDLTDLSMTEEDLFAEDSDSLSIDDILDEEEDPSIKLDLARAYIDMGNSASAIEALQEVLQGGNTGQKEDAQKLLEKLKS